MKHGYHNRRVRMSVTVLTLLSMGVLLSLVQFQSPCHGAEAAAITPPADWLSRVQGDLAAMEYQITWQVKCSLPIADVQAMRLSIP